MQNSQITSGGALARLGDPDGCELLQQSRAVRRVLGPGGVTIEAAELDVHFDEGRFPGLR